LQADTALIEAANGSDGGKVRPMTMADLDRRTAAYRNADQLLHEILSDLGGEDHTSAGQRQLAQRASVLAAMIADAEARWLRGDAIDLAGYLASVNAHRRVLATLGLERRARPVRSLHDIIHGEATG
jgi:hypothetical protein